jgi:hypothetical protein
MIPFSKYQLADDAVTSSHIDPYLAISFLDLLMFAGCISIYPWFGE